MSATTPEGKVKAKIDAILKPYVRRKVMAYNKTAGSMFGTNGWPDYDGVLLGLFWSIEAKHYPKKPTDIQQPRIDAIKEAKGIAIVIDEKNLEKLDTFFQKLEQRGLAYQEFLSAHS